MTRSLPGTIVLALALVTHMALGLFKLARRDHAAASALGAGAARARAARSRSCCFRTSSTRASRTCIFGVEDIYLYELARLWPASAILQSTLLLIVWVHGCIGIHYWLRLYPPYRAALPVLLFSPSPSRSPRSAASWSRAAPSPPRSRMRARSAKVEGADALAERRRWRERSRWLPR